MYSEKLKLSSNIYRGVLRSNLSRRRKL